MSELYPKHFGELKIDRRFARWWMKNDKQDIPKRFRRSLTRAVGDRRISFSFLCNEWRLTRTGKKFFRVLAEIGGK